MITKQIKSKLKNRSKITKEYYRKGQYPIIFAELSRISRECTDLTSYTQKNVTSYTQKNVMFLMTDAQIQKSIGPF